MYNKYDILTLDIYFFTFQGWKVYLLIHCLGFYWNYGHFASCSFFPQSLRSIIKVTSLHNQSHFTPCKKLVKHYRELFVLMLELDWFWTYVSSDLSTNAASHICSHLVTQNIILFDYSPQYKFLYVVIPQNPRYCIKEILEGVSWLILIVLLPTFQYTLTGVIGDVVSLLPYVNGWKRAMTMHNWNGTRELYASNAGR